MAASKSLAGLVFLLLVSSAVVCLPVGLNAQVLYGSIVGSVTDSTGAAVPGAHVIVTSPQIGLTRITDADSAGLYSVPNLPEGTYDVKVTSRGFKELLRRDVGVKVGAVVRSDAKLEVGAVSQEVTVSASGVELQTDKSEVTTRLGTVPVENLPTGIYRNFQYLLTLVPGAAEIQGTTGAVADTPERALAIPMNGLGPASNSTRIDGAQSIFLWKPGGAALYVPPIEAIQEVKITTNSYDPEKGMAGSAAMDVITKSGTNQFHATAFEYHSDQALQSREAFDYTPGKKPKHILNDLGGNFGGPIIKDKLFFFVNWDGIFQRDNFSDTTITVPGANYRQGDFSKYLGSLISFCQPSVTDNTMCAKDASGKVITIAPVMVPTSDGHGVIGPLVQLQQGMVFDPNTGNPDGTGRAVYAAGTTAATPGQLNVMPADLIDPTASTIMGLWPLPNFTQLQQIDPNTGYESKNYFMSANQRFNRNNYDSRIDWNRTQSHLVWGKYSQMNALTTDSCGFNQTIGGPCPSQIDSPGKTHDVVHTATLGHTWTLTPTFVVDGSLGLSRMDVTGFPYDYGKNVGLEVLHIPGTNDPNDIRYSGAPNITVADFSPLGSAFTWQPMFRNDWTVTNSHNASWVHGSHTIRFGFDYIHNHMNHWQPENGLGPRGGIKFTRGDVTALNTNSFALTDKGYFTSRDNQFADFLLGKYDEAGRAVQLVKMSGKDDEYGFHFLERWRITPRFTANLGVRYEYYPLMSRDSLGGGLEQYDPATNTMRLGGLGGVPRNLGIRTEKNLWAPRVGLAYSVNDKTVVRAGFGSTFDTYPILRELRGTYPDVVSVDTTYNTSGTGFNSLATCSAGGGTLCSYQGLGTFAGGVKAVPLPNLSAGVIPIPTDVDARFVAPGLLRRGRIQTWNAAVERKLPGDFVTSIAYVGNHMTHGWGQIDLNASDIDQPAPLSQQWNRTASTLQLQGYLDSHYNALQVTLDRNFSKGLYVHGGYTWSKAIDENSDNAWGGALWMAPFFAGPGYLSHNRGMADFDHRHIFRMSYVWELPMGRGHRAFGSSQIGSAVLGGWSLTGIWDTTTGSPTTIFGNPYNFIGSGNWQTLDQVAPLKNTGGLGPEKFWYDPASFAEVPYVKDPSCPFSNGCQHRFGTTGRNMPLYGPRHSNLDAGLFRQFQLGEKYRLQFRAEGLNVMNHPTWEWDTGLWGQSNFCWQGSNGLCDLSSGFMKANRANGHRTLRLGLRLSF